MKKFENVTFIGEMSLWGQGHLPWKVGPLHIFFIIFMDPAKEYLYTGEVRKKFKVGIFFYSQKSVKMWLK